MCGHHVIDSVRRTMLSRRALMGGGAAAGVALAAAPVVVPPPARAEGGAGTLTDLTHTLTTQFPTFSGKPQFEMTEAATLADNGYNGFVLRVDEHTGTHLDAPLHFSEDGISVDALAVETLMAPLVVIDIRGRATEDPDAVVTPDDVAAWIDSHGALPDGCCVAMLSGWAERAGGEGFRNADADGIMHFPGFHPETAEMLLEESTAVGLAVDTLSLDPGMSPDFATHKTWLPKTRWGLEAVANLSAVPPAGATLIVGAPKHAGGSGGPTRALALA